MNIACNASTSLNQILDQLRTLLGTDIEAVYEQPRAGDVKHSLADYTLATEMIGYKPLVYFEEGLQLAIDWYRQNL